MRKETRRIAILLGSTQVFIYLSFLLVLIMGGSGNGFGGLYIWLMWVIYWPIYWLFSLLPPYLKGGGGYGSMFFGALGIPLIGTVIYTALFTWLVVVVKTRTKNKNDQHKST